MATAHLHFSLLGEFGCHSTEGQMLAFPTRKVDALLAYLAASAGQRHRRDKLAALLWEDKPESLARANLRKTLSRLQQSIPDTAHGCLMVDAHELGLKASAIAVDLVLFERLVADGTPETLERALVLYRGPFLEGLAECGEAFEDWLMAERRRLDETLQQVLRRLLDHYVITGAIDPAIQLTLKLLAIDPLDEGVQRTLIRLYIYQDRIGAALEQYRRCRERLADELGVEPAPETERLKTELLGLLPGNADNELALPREHDDPPERTLVIETAAEVRARRRMELAGRPAIAVLAFAPVEDAATCRHLGDGMMEDIATELGRFRELEVIAPATALAYREAAAAPERIGAELGVRQFPDKHVPFLEPLSPGGRGVGVRGIKLGKRHKPRCAGQARITPTLTLPPQGGGDCFIGKSPKLCPGRQSQVSGQSAQDHRPAAGDGECAPGLGRALRLRTRRDLRRPGRRDLPHRRQSGQADRRRLSGTGPPQAAAGLAGLRSLAARLECPETPRSARHP